MAEILSVGTPKKAIDLMMDKPKIKKAVVKAGHSDEHADAFLADLNTEHGNINTVLTTIDSAILGKLVGKGLVTAVQGNNALKTLLGGLLGPQYVVLAASFSMSVHAKGDNLQLWVEYKKGGKQIMVDTPNPNPGAKKKK